MRRGNGVRARVVAAAGLATAALAVAAAPAGATIGTNYIVNLSTIKLGVIHVRDGSYVYGSYDALLPPNQYTDVNLNWGTTAGWYTGAGYCTQQWRSDIDLPNHFVRQTPDLGAGQHFIGGHTYYKVKPYRC